MQSGNIKSSDSSLRGMAEQVRKDNAKKPNTTAVFGDNVQANPENIENFGTAGK